MHPYLQVGILSQQLSQYQQETAKRIVDLQKRVDHLESQLPQEPPQASEEQPAPTESVTRAENSAAVVHLALVSMETGAITPRIQLLQRLLGALTPDERTLAARESWLADPLVSFASRVLMLVRDAELLTSTLARPATSPSAATPSAAATSPSGSSEAGVATAMRVAGYPDNWQPDVVSTNSTAAPEPSPAPSHEARCGNYSKWSRTVCDMPLDHFRKTGQAHSGIGSMGRVFWGEGSINYPFQSSQEGAQD